MKKIALALISIIIVNYSIAQNVFTYGNKAVTKDEFVKAFNKNPNISGNRKKALQDYLDLYIRFKLKVQAAYDAGLDKDATQQNELQNFRNQLADNIINEQANLKALAKEALERSQKEIHLAQVFIEVPGNADTAEAYNNIHTAYKQLKEGKDFGTVSQQFSTDESTKQTKGDLGFISVFTLPYDLENIAYNLPTNSFSAPVRTKAGYHIFKKIGERKSLGSRRVAQILISFPPDATAEEKNIASRKADSIYNLLVKGTSFEDLAAKVSNDLSSNNNKGELPEFTSGTYSPEFESVAFSLQKPGDFSKPFQTSYGYHILKLIEAKPVPDPNNPAALATLEEQVAKDNRMEKSKKELIDKKLALIKYKPANFNEKALFIFTDSDISNPNTKNVKGINENTLLFSFAKQNIKASDWVQFVKSSESAAGRNAKENYSELFKKFIQASADDYYRKHLDDYNSGFSQQVKEFKEANLLFGVMEKNVWSKANTDTAGLIQYYNLHKSKYKWPASADAIIVTCKTQKLAEEMQQKLKDSLSNWRKITANNGNDVTADSGRFELGQLAVAERTNFTPGLLTYPVKNTSDESYTFNYVIRVYQGPDDRTFEDARGMVISDYQQEIEDKWIEELKKKYPVKVNEAVFRTIK
ncbi:foldase protein PrsA [Segetibacter koreensis]|uniref:foldase protein PrsA n=1 Tax=Segetibacter koreensis TaxID=398037 RepID=UPI00036EABFD|nr:foldase protein PrsA [Segetibacter koreensis]